MPWPWRLPVRLPSGGRWAAPAPPAAAPPPDRTQPPATAAEIAGGRHRRLHDEGRWASSVRCGGELHLRPHRRHGDHDPRADRARCGDQPSADAGLLVQLRGERLRRYRVAPDDRVHLHGAAQPDDDVRRQSEHARGASTVRALGSIRRLRHRARIRADDGPRCGHHARRGHHDRGALAPRPRRAAPPKMRGATAETRDRRFPRSPCLSISASTRESYFGPRRRQRATRGPLRSKSVPRYRHRSAWGGLQQRCGVSGRPNQTRRNATTATRFSRRW